MNRAPDRKNALNRVVKHASLFYACNLFLSLGAHAQFIGPGGGGSGGGGGVSSVGLALPGSVFNVTGSPITGAGTLTGTFASQSANTFLASPNGTSGTPSFRQVFPADLPVATTSAFGAVKPDGITITVSGGVITSVGGGGSGAVSLTAGNGLLVTPSPITGVGKISTTLNQSLVTGTAYTTASGDGGSTLSFSNTGTVAVTLSAASGTGFTSGFALDYANINSGSVTITTAGSVFDNGLTSVKAAQGQDANVWSDSTNYHAALSLPVIGVNHLLANVSASGNYPSDATVTSLLDAALGNTQGNILYRGASTWTVLAPGTSGQFLKTLGAGQNPAWATSSGGGGGSGCVPGGLAGQVLLDSGSGSCTDSTGLSDNGTKVTLGEPFDLSTFVLGDTLANDTTSGTTLHLLAKWTSTGLVTLGTADTSFQGIVFSGAGTSGSGQVARTGQTTCLFDDATTKGDYAIASTVSGGYCHDTGSTVLPSAMVVGKVLSTNAASGTYSVDVSPQNPGAQGATPNNLYFSNGISLNQGGTTGLLIGGSALTAADTLSTTTQAIEAAAALPTITVSGTHAFTATRLTELYLPLAVAGPNVTATQTYSLITGGQIYIQGTITGTNGASLTGGTEQINGTTNINVGQNSATNINTGTSNGAITIGNASHLGNLILANLGTDSALSSYTVCWVSGTGVTYFGSGTGGVCAGTISSERFKHDITPIDYGLIDLMKLRPVNWHYNKGVGDSGAKLQRGFIAENVAVAMPRLANYDSRGRPNGVDLLGMIPSIVKSVQDDTWLIGGLFAWNLTLTGLFIRRRR